MTLHLHILYTYTLVSITFLASLLYFNISNVFLLLVLIGDVLYRGLKLLITNILAGLMENDLAKIMDFDDFFKEIEKIHRKKVLAYTLLTWRFQQPGDR